MPPSDPWPVVPDLAVEVVSPTDILDKLLKKVEAYLRAGVVQVRPIAQQRVYNLRPQAFRELDDWLESYRRLWDDRHDRLNDYLRKAEKEKKHGRAN